MSTPAPETTAKKKLDAPYGWVIKTYKRMNIPSSDHEKTEEVFSDLINLIPNEGSVRDVTYGNYDRISMYPVNCFSDFTDRSYKTIDWYGSSQAIILFPLEQDSSKRTYVWGRKSEDENNKVYLQDEGGIRVPEGFFAISFCYISDEARNHVGNYREFLQECRDRINSLVELYNSKLRNDEGAKEAHGTIRAEVFGSFSPAELVVLWSAPQYSDILYLIDLIRLFRFPSQQKKGADGEEKGASFDSGLFRTTYTMLSFPNVLNNNLLETFPLKNVKGKAHIQFVMQSSFGECAYDEFEKFLRSSLENAAQMTGDSLPPDYNLDVCRCAGEYDMIWTVDSRYLPCIHVNPLIIRVSGSHKKEDHVSLLDLKQYAPEEKLDIHLPRAVYTAKLNARIRAQSGLFVAFSLKSKPVVWEDTKITTDKVSAGLFYYQALETIQEYYLKMKGKRPFLFKIIIPCDLREEIGKLMYQFGISKERIYPELENNRNR